MSRAELTDPVAVSARRILLLGVTGSGKSTLARALESREGIPAIDVDALALQPGWVTTPEAELRARAAEIAATDTWVMDSAWTAIRPVVLPRTQLVVGLDLPRGLTLARLIRRTAQRLITRERVCGDNVESWRQTLLSSDSIIAWHARSVGSKHRQIGQWQDDPAYPPVLALSTPREVATWLDLRGGQLRAR